MVNVPVHPVTAHAKGRAALLAQPGVHEGSGGIPEELWGWRGAWQGHSLQESREMGSFVVLEDFSLEACGHHQLNRVEKAHQAASTSASLGFLKHSHSKER